MDATIAVVIGTYNNADHVAATLQSVREQRRGDWQCLVVDNGSSDDTVARVRRLVEGDARFTILCKANEGPSAGRNFGFARLGSGIEFVHFLDGDDCLHPEFLQRLVGHLQAHPQVGLVGCQFDIIDKDGAPLGPGHRSRYAPGRFGWPRALRDDELDTPFETFFAATGQGPFAVFRRSVLARTSGYEPDFWSHEDADIFCQMALLARVHYLPDRLYAKRVHGHNLTASPRADYGKFRRKWDSLRSADPAIDRRIDAALAYYHGRHAPLRHLKVAVLAAREFVATGRSRHLLWSLSCLRAGLADLLLRRALWRHWQARRQAARALRA